MQYQAAGALREGLLLYRNDQFSSTGKRRLSPNSAAATAQALIEGSACAVAPARTHRGRSHEVVAVKLAPEHGPMLREPVHVELMGARWTIKDVCPAVQHRTRTASGITNRCYD